MLDTFKQFFNRTSNTATPAAQVPTAKPISSAAPATSSIAGGGGGGVGQARSAARNTTTFELETTVFEVLTSSHHGAGPSADPTTSAALSVKRMQKISRAAHKLFNSPEMPPEDVIAGAVPSLHDGTRRARLTVVFANQIYALCVVRKAARAATAELLKPLPPVVTPPQIIIAGAPSAAVATSGAPPAAASMPLPRPRSSLVQQALSAHRQLMANGAQLAAALTTLRAKLIDHTHHEVGECPCQDLLTNDKFQMWLAESIDVGCLILREAATVFENDRATCDALIATASAMLEGIFADRAVDPTLEFRRIVALCDRVPSLSVRLAKAVEDHFHAASVEATAAAGASVDARASAFVQLLRRAEARCAADLTNEARRRVTQSAKGLFLAIVDANVLKSWIDGATGGGGNKGIGDSSGDAPSASFAQLHDYASVCRWLDADDAEGQREGANELSMVEHGLNTVTAALTDMLQMDLRNIVSAESNSCDSGDWLNAVDGHVLRTRRVVYRMFGAEREVQSYALRDKAMRPLVTHAGPIIADACHNAILSSPEDAAKAFATTKIVIGLLQDVEECLERMHSLLLRRLFMNRQVDLDLETELLSILRQQTGSYSGGAVHRSRTALSEYQQWRQQAPQVLAPGQDPSSVLVIGAHAVSEAMGSWLLRDVPRCLPMAMQRDLEGLTGRYHQLQAKRTLTWVARYCTATVTVLFCRSPVNITTTWPVACALMAFNGRVAMSRDEFLAEGKKLCESAGDDIKRSLDLFLSKFDLLREDPTGTLIVVNEGFNSKVARRSTLALLPVRESRLSGAARSAPNAAATAAPSDQEVQARVLHCQVVATRIMKSRRVMRHVDLRNEIVQALVARFPVDGRLTKKAIDGLLEKNIIARTEGNVDEYCYVA